MAQRLAPRLCPSCKREVVLTEDLLTAGILYLLYRESGDGDWLIVMLAYLFL